MKDYDRLKASYSRSEGCHRIMSSGSSIDRPCAAWELDWVALGARPAKTDTTALTKLTKLTKCHETSWNVNDLLNGGKWLGLREISKIDWELRSWDKFKEDLSHFNGWPLPSWSHHCEVTPELWNFVKAYFLSVCLQCLHIYMVFIGFTYV